MRKSVYAIFFAVLLLAFSCDSIEGDFDESLPDFYTLTTTVSLEEGGTIEPSGGEFLAGSSRQIVARPAEGYVFDNWSGDLAGNTNPTSIQFNTNRSVTAHFSLREYNLNLEITGNGTVSETIVDQSSSFTVRLEAEAEEGWLFDRWEGDLTGNSNPETITIEENEEKSVTAIFERVLPEYSFKINKKGQGSVEKDPDKESYTEGEEVALTAKPASGWIFKEWQGDLSGSSNPETITADEDKQITAVFEIDDEFGITVNEVKLFIREMKLEGARITRDFNIRDFILNVPTEESPFEITHVDIPRGFYDELDLDIRKPESKIELDDSEFRDGSGSYSLVVKGTFNGVDFTYRSEEDYKFEADISPHLEILSGQTTVIALTIDFEGWFMGDKDGYLDPSDSRNTKQINDNIKDSFSDFEDEF